MVNAELSTKYSELISLRKRRKEALRLGNALLYIGSFIFLWTNISDLNYNGVNIFPWYLNLTNIFYVYFSSIPFVYWLIILEVIGILILFIGGLLGQRKSLPKRLPANQKEFIKMYDALICIDSYLKNEDSSLKQEAIKQLKTISKNIELPENDPFDLNDTLLSEATDQLHRLRSILLDKIIPNVEQGNKEIITKIYPNLERLAYYFLNPTFSKLTDLNNSMTDINTITKTITFTYRINSWLAVPMGFMRAHTKIFHVIMFSSFIVLSIFTYFVGTNLLQTTKDTAFSAASNVFAVCFIGYLALILSSYFKR
jgi:hypothetical protein